nr:hypothetical protein [Tanacetum cinerariifolium]
MAYEEFSKFLKNTVGFAHSLYYKVPNVELEMGLVRVSNSKELYYMVDVANVHGWLELYRGPPKTRYCNKFSVDELVNYAGNEVEKATQDEAVQGEDNQQQQQDNLVEHDNPKTTIYVE